MGGLRQLFNGPEEMMDAETRRLWQYQADTYNQKYGVYRRTGSKGCEAPVIEAWRKGRKYVEVVSPRRNK